MIHNYNFFDQILHKIILKNKFLLKSLFEIENIIFKQAFNHNVNEGEHLFITGLSRCGSTNFLNLIYSSSQYSSLTYSDVPFLTSPNLFGWIKKKNIKEYKRLHKDGIFYNEKSPEFFDEVFLRLYANDNFAVNISKYLSNILFKYNGKKYISKNTYNIKRVKILSKIFPNSKFIILYRDPISHACSLLNQHLNFIKIQNQFNFVKIYMDLLKHHEFGLQIKPFFKPVIYHDNKNINYWVEQWINYYDFFLQEVLKEKKVNKKILILSLNNMVDNTEQHIRILNNFTSSNLKYDPKFKFKIKHYQFEKIDEVLKSRAIYIYKELNKLSGFKSNLNM